jgi:hypothetical protein
MSTYKRRAELEGATDRLVYGIGGAIKGVLIGIAILVCIKVLFFVVVLAAALGFKYSDELKSFFAVVLPWIGYIFLGWLSLVLIIKFLLVITDPVELVKWVNGILKWGKYVVGGTLFTVAYWASIIYFFG